MSLRTLAIQRYLPEQGAEPFEAEFQLDCEDGDSLLDVLLRLQAEQDPSLALRWSCRMSICGSCGLMVDGRPTLACRVFMRELPQRIELAPLSHFPVLKDLVVDFQPFVDKLAAVSPWLVGDTEGEDPHRQTPAQRARYQAYASCINCGLCYSACPQFGLNPGFIGPAAITLAQRYNLDSRDRGQALRMPVLNGDDGVWACTFVGYCAEVCPKALDPAAAVNQGKLASALDFAAALLPWSGR